MENSDIGDWLKLFVLCIFGLGTAVVFFLFFNSNSIFTKATGAQASLTFHPYAVSVKKDEVFSSYRGCPRAFKTVSKTH
ncbi:MAG: hypothetical protein HQK53_14510 [Oligoflexia bacterium]|nr:hypothetical protein [Oligoflexia bacterium]